MAKFTADGTELQIATDIDFENIVNEDDGSYRTSQSFAEDELPYGVNLFTRVRYLSDELGGHSDWSPVISFHVEVPADVIGICIDQNNGRVIYIDINGNEVSTYLWQKSNIFKKMSMCALDQRAPDEQYLKVPKFYIKTSVSGVIGTITEGKLCYWVSDTKLQGFRTHLAFKRSPGGGESDFTYIGAYAGSVKTVGGKSCVVSEANVKATPDELEALVTKINDRNSAQAGQLGYRGFDIYDMAMLRLLGMIMYKSTDFQRLAGNGTDTASPLTGTSDAKLIFLGDKSDPRVFIADLWRTYQVYLFKISAVDGKVALKFPYSDEDLFPAGVGARYTMPQASGYMSSVLDCPISVGTDVHDLMELFLPKTVVGSEALSTFKDYYVYQGGKVDFKTGGSWKETANWCGPFFTNLKPYKELGGFTTGTHEVGHCPYAYGQDKCIEAASGSSGLYVDAITGEKIQSGFVYKWYVDDSGTHLTKSNDIPLCPHARGEYNNYSLYPTVHQWNKSPATFKETPCGMFLMGSISSSKAYCPSYGYNKYYAEQTDWILGGTRCVLAGTIYERNRETIIANNMVARICKN